MGFIQEKIYPHLPVGLQNLAISAFGYLWYKRRFGGIFESEYSKFKARESFTNEQWQQYQTGQLRKILVHAFDSVPHYTKSFIEAGLTKEKLEQLELHQLRELPILEKDVLREKGRSGLLSSMREKGGEFYSSSGSTGTPTDILYSHAMHQRLSALYEARVRNFAGVTKDEPRGMIGGRRIIPEGNAKPPFYRYNFIEKQVYFSAYHISKNTVYNYVDGLKKHGAKYMVGYAMSNYILARLIKQEGLNAPQMKAVLTSSEKLTADMRATISEVFQCKVYDAWSGVEWCGLISENEHGQLLASPDCAILEIIKPNGEYAKPGESGELVCTGFLNYDQPLIRYKIGDVVRLAFDQKTKCGRSFTVIDEIIGRHEDIVVGSDGREMVRFHGIFVNLPNVIKGQVVQETKASFTINVATIGLTEDERAMIKQRMKSQLGEISLHINEMDDIPVGANGKFKAVISKIKNERSVV
jgi:phenylacetate-CoA ligase